MVEVRLAWNAFRSQLLAWILIGVLFGLIVAGIGSLNVLARGDSGIWTPVGLAASHVASILGFLMSGAVVGLALHQLRSGGLRLQHARLGPRAVFDLSVAAVASTAAYNGFLWLATSFMKFQWEVAYVVWFVVSIPFAFTLPILVDQRLSALASTRQSLRLGLPLYFRILGIQICVVVATIILMCPLACLSTLILNSNSRESESGFEVVFLFASVGLMPLYELTMCAAYIRAHAPMSSKGATGQSSD